MSILVGRNQELDLLAEALRAASRGTGGCLLLTGEAGIGKSRLLAELKQRASAEDFTILQGNCFEQSLSFPYAPWIDALRLSFDSLDAAQISELLGPLAPEFTKLLPELALLIPSLEPSTVLEPLAEKYRLFESFARLGASLSASAPLLLILEDLHWADALSLELVHYFVRRIHDRSILLVGTYRTEEAPPPLLRLLSELDRERLAREILLGPLSHADVERLARALLETAQPVPDAFVTALLSLTEGNPFFIEEVLKNLTEEGRAGQLLQQQSLGELPVPHSIQRMVQQRVEQLPDATQAVLVHAALIGERFDFGLLQETTARSEQELLHALKESLDAHLVLQESADHFRFTHALTCDAISSMVMLRERKAIHQTIGAALERLAGTRLEAPAAQLAYHFYQGGVWQKALECSQRAGQQAQALYAPREAITHFTRALDAAQQLGAASPYACLRGRAQGYEVLGEFEHARRDYEAALELARGAAARADEWQALVDLGFLWQSRAWLRSGEYFERAYTLARSLEQAALIAQSLNRIGYWRAHGGQLREAQSDHQQALQLFKELNDRRGMAQTLELLGLDSYTLGEVVQGVAYCEQAVHILRELDDRQGLANTLTTLSFHPRLDTEVMGDMDLRGLAALSEEALEIARSCDYRVGEAAALHEGAACLCRAGEYGRGWEYLGRALRIAEEIEHRELLASVHLAWGSEFHLGLLALADAREHLEAARSAAQERGSPAFMLHTTASLAHACILQQDLARARALLDALLPGDLPEAAGMSSVLRSCWAARAELELASGSPARALEIVDLLLASTANLAQHGPQSVPRLAQLRGKALVALGRVEDALVEFQGAQAVSRKQGQRAMLWRLSVDAGKACQALGRRAEAQREFAAARTLIQDMAATLPPGALRDHFIQQALGSIPAEPVLTPRQAAMQEYGGLTERERQVAALIAQGRSNREIAAALVVTVRTVEAHITRILDKLGFKSRTEIAAWAVARGLARVPRD